MKTLILAIATAFALSACGADGPPTRPAPKPVVQSGLTVSGTAEIGITGGS